MTPNPLSRSCNTTACMQELGMLGNHYYKVPEATGRHDVTTASDCLTLTSIGNFISGKFTVLRERINYLSSVHTNPFSARGIYN